MGEQEISRALGAYGPFDPYTENLLRMCLDHVDQRLFSGPHIMLAALRWDYLLNMLRSSQSVRGIQQLNYLLQRNGLGMALKSWIDLPVDFWPGEVITYGLATALEAGRVAAHKGAMTAVQLLQVLFMHDVDVQAATSVLNGGGYSYSTSPVLPSLPSNVPGFAYPVVRHEATRTRRYAARHHAQMESVLWALAERRADEVILTRGLFGSPLCRVEHVLADILIDPEQDVLPSNLARYNHVLTLEVAKLHAAGMEDVASGVAVLQDALALARTWRAILILTRGELLDIANGELGRVNRHILGTLLQTGGVPVIIAFEERDEKQYEAERILPLIKPREVKMPAYTRENAIAAIPEYYDAIWKEAKILVRSEEALACILELESAIFASSSGVVKRKVLPYSVADLLQQAIETIHREIRREGQIRALALTAKQRIETVLGNLKEGRMLFTCIDLLDQMIETRSDQPDIVNAARTMRDRWKPRCELLIELKERMQRLAHNPVIEQTDGMYVLSQDIVTAQFFSDDGYHLRFVEAFEDDVRAYEPRLLDEISRAYE